MINDIVKDIENFGECYIGTAEVQGPKVFKRYEKVGRAYEKEHPGAVLAYNSETGICWEV